MWSIQNGEMVNTLIHHCEAVLHLRFSDGIMVTCSKVLSLMYQLLFAGSTPGVLEHSSSCCCSNSSEGTLLFCISVYAVSVAVLTYAVDLHKTASRLWAVSP